MGFSNSSGNESMVAGMQQTVMPVSESGLRAEAAQAAVRIRGLKKHFGTGEQRVEALRGIDWEVYAGEMTLIVGPSGCGKTTLLSVIAGILDCNEGQVAIFGHELTAMRDNQRTRFRARNIGFVFQQYNLLPALSAAENAAIPLVIAGWSKTRAVNRAAMCSRRLGWGRNTTGCPMSSPAGRCSGWRSRGPWFTSLGSWYAMSRPPRSTTKPG